MRCPWRRKQTSSKPPDPVGFHSIFFQSTFYLLQTKVLLFDFDGTLADTLKPAHAIFNQLAGEFGFRSMPEAELPEARQMSARQIMKAYGISMKMVPRVAARGLSLLKENMESIQPFPGIMETLFTLKEQGFILGILTSNSEANVRIFLQKHELEIFDFVRSSSRLFGKAREIRQILKKGRWQPEDVIFLGDECRDIEAGHEAGLRVVAVTWGYNAPKALAALKPMALIDAPHSIPGWIDPPEPMQE
jgi:phosphoglycolate phosphatase